MQARAGLGAGLAYRGGLRPAGLAEAGAEAVLSVEVVSGVRLRAAVGGDAHTSPAGVAYSPSVGAGVDVGMVRVDAQHVLGDEGFSRLRAAVVGGRGGGVAVSALVHRDARTGRWLGGLGIGF